MNSFNSLVLGLLAATAVFPVAAAEKPDTVGAISAPESKVEYFTPESIKGSTKVDTDAVVELVSSVDNLTLIDSRIMEDRVYGHIEGSVSLPDINTNCKTLAKMVPDHAAPVLFYCNGIKCGRSVRAVNIARDCGYSKIYWYREGFADWQATGLPFIKSSKQ